ncbi:MAG: aminotransferase class I/II-fold pyridoxal phosphate-dependent enzyme [bacterium]
MSKNNNISPIYNRLKTINTYPFHMPGHKRNPKILADFKNFIDLDFTEIPPTDNLFNAKEVILESMQNTSKIFGSYKTYFLVNGSTSGILASIMSQVKRDEYIMILKNCHVSVHNAVALAGAKPLYVKPMTKKGITCGVSIKKIKKTIKRAVKEGIKIKALVLTSPTYEGLVINIKKVSKLLKKYGIMLIVDEAHGAHFNFSERFPKSGLKCGADVVIQSFHKTLPSFTQCAVIHINKNNINIKSLEKYLSVVQTTSPSYIFMLSLEYATNYASTNTKKIQKYTEKLLSIRTHLTNNLKVLKLIDKNFLKNTGAIDYDISRLSFLIKDKYSSNLNGELLYNEFLYNNIQLEMYSRSHVIAISTICDDLKELENFKEVVTKIDKKLFKLANKNIKNKNKNNLKSLDSSLNKTCSSDIIPYPPGIPLVLSGEVITYKIIKKLKNLIKNNVNIIGLENNKIYINK